MKWPTFPDNRDFVAKDLPELSKQQWQLMSCASTSKSAAWHSLGSFSLRRWRRAWTSWSSGSWAWIRWLWRSPYWGPSPRGSFVSRQSWRWNLKRSFATTWKVPRFKLQSSWWWTSSRKEACASRVGGVGRYAHCTGGSSGLWLRLSLVALDLRRSLWLQRRGQRKTSKGKFSQEHRLLVDFIYNIWICRFKRKLHKPWHDSCSKNLFWWEVQPYEYVHIRFILWSNENSKST